MLKERMKFIGVSSMLDWPVSCCFLISFKSAWLMTLMVLCEYKKHLK